jgi:uncharacterized iron-regulated membrane protein
LAPGRSVAGNVDAALGAAQAARPGRRIRDVRLPNPETLNVFFFAPDVSPHAVDRVRVDLAAGRVRDVTPAGRAGGLWMTLLPIHSGDTFGVAGSLVVLVGALGLITLAVTGPLIWWQARRRQ